MTGIKGELFTYDGFNQISICSQGTLNAGHNGITGTASRTQGWSHDALGNMVNVTTNGTGQSRATNAENEYTSISGLTTPVYSTNGDMTTDTSGKTYVYDAWDRLVAVKNGSSTLKSLSYDGLGRKVTDTLGGTTTNIYYDGTQEIEDKAGSTWTVRNVWGDAYVNDLVLRDNGASLGTRLYPTEDANWNVTSLVNTSGSVVERGVYDPFGAEQYYNASWGSISGSAYAWTISFQSMRLDTTTGQSETDNRWYDPIQQRWTTNDPSLYSAGDPNLYRALGNGPIGAVDPSGLAPVPVREEKDLIP